MTRITLIYADNIFHNQICINEIKICDNPRYLRHPRSKKATIMQHISRSFSVYKPCPKAVTGLNTIVKAKK